jgi:(p)ppGpp synthase/HD superfamily hydrolase
MEIELEVWDLEHLNRIVAGLKGKPVVSAVDRVFA